MSGVEFAVFSDRLERLQEKIRLACAKADRAADTVQLLPVTKTHPAEAIRCVARSGLPAVGENRLQEAEEKRREASDTPVRWELIGHLQKNKARKAIATFDRIQSVDSLKLAQTLSRIAEEENRVLPVLLQVNAGDDPAKYGVSVEPAEDFLRKALKLSALRVEGLMTIAPFDEDESVARACFRRLRGLRDRLQESTGHPLPELSMGMSGDYEAAIAEGSTVIRVGSALFGARPQ